MTGRTRLLGRRELRAALGSSSAAEGPSLIARLHPPLRSRHLGASVRRPQPSRKFRQEDRSRVHLPTPPLFPVRALRTPSVPSKVPPEILLGGLAQGLRRRREGREGVGCHRTTVGASEEQEVFFLRFYGVALRQPRRSVLRRPFSPLVRWPTRSHPPKVTLQRSPVGRR